MLKILLYDLEALTDKNSKDWDYHFNLLKDNLTDFIHTLKDKLAKYKRIMQDNGKVIVKQQDKLRRRNMQIKDLKAEKEKVATQLGYLTQHLLTVEEYHPDYLEDIKNNMI